MNDLRPGWHVSASDLATYGDGRAHPLAMASIEAHLLACEQCRGVLADERAHVVDLVWAGIAERIDVPRRPLRWSTGALQVSLASPPLFAATAGVALALLAVVAYIAVADPAWSLPLLLVLAPLAPIAGGAIAFRPGIDPAGTLSVATPLAGGRLPFLRALVASAFSQIGRASGRERV